VKFVADFGAIGSPTLKRETAPNSLSRDRQIPALRNGIIAWNGDLTIPYERKKWNFLRRKANEL